MVAMWHSQGKVLADTVLKFQTEAKLLLCDFDVYSRRKP
jgi:hypothetical protein